MKINQVSFGFATNKIQETKEFYEKYLGAKTIFEKKGYINLRLGDGSTVLGIETPQDPDGTPSDTTGWGFGITIDDVDQAYDEITDKKLPIEMPLVDHPWGERGFGIKDPNGLTIYIYEITGEPAEEYKKYVKK